MTSREWFEQLLVTETEVFVAFTTLDATIPGDILAQDTCVLKYSRLYQNQYQPRVDDEGIECCLTFGGRPFATFVPWANVYSIYAAQPSPTKPAAPKRKNHLSSC